MYRMNTKLWPLRAHIAIGPNRPTCHTVRSISLMFTRKATGLFSLASAIIAATLVAHAAPPPGVGPRNGCTARPGDPSTGIQHAVDSGCTQIRVTPETYYENVTIPAGDTVTITGAAGASKTIVD